MTGNTDARAALYERLGPGARRDDERAPSEELRWARLGTAYFARKLNKTSDAQLTARTGEGLRFRRIVCAVSYRARSFAHLIESVRNGVPVLGPELFEAEVTGMELGVTLPAAALRHLFKHSEVHLNVEWRDLRGDEWDTTVCLPGQKTATVRDTAWRRARSIWLSAVDLGNGGSFADLPPDLVDAVLADSAARWDQSEAITLQPSDRQAPIVLGRPASGLTVTGKAAALARWVTGRGIHNIQANGALPAIAADRFF